MKWSLSKGYTKKKRWFRVLLPAFLLFALGGCSFSEAMFTDSGTNLIVENDTSAYLDLSLLEKQDGVETDDAWNGYDIWTLEYGTFATEIIETRANITMVESVPAKVEIPLGSMILTELLVSRYSYVEKGDVLARVDVEISALDLEEMELKLKRLEEEYAQAVEDYNELYEEAVANISVYNHPGNIDRIEIAQMELDFEQTRANYDKRVADYKEQIKDMKAVAATKEIVAPQSGFVLSVSRLGIGQELSNGTVICTISPSDKIFWEITDENFHYGYGMELTMGVGANSNVNRKEYSVVVSSASGKSLKEDWGKTTTQIMGDFTLEEIMNSGALMVGGQTNVMDNVLLIPKEAVTVEREKYYVTVLHEDATLEKRQFIPGGNNQEYYWVFRGLEPGTKIIVEN